jgi:hypothetical protein
MFVKSALRASLVIAFSMVCIASVAQAQNDVSCPTEARKAAAEWGGSVIQPVKDSIQARPADSLLLIAGGHSYLYKAADAAGDVRILPKLGAMARDYNHVYSQSYDRCRAGERGVVIVRSGLFTDVKIIR